VLAGIVGSQGGERMTDQVNHLQWIAGHLANARFNYSVMLGLDVQFPYKELYVDPTQPPPGNRPIDPALEYPSLNELLKLWNAVSPSFVEALAGLKEEQLSKKLPFETPIRDNTMAGLFGFLSSHESSHIGQMSIIRKYLGLSAMSYQ